MRFIITMGCLNVFLIITAGLSYHYDMKEYNQALNEASQREISAFDSRIKLENIVIEDAKPKGIKVLSSNESWVLADLDRESISKKNIEIFLFSKYEDSVKEYTIACLKNEKENDVHTCSYAYKEKQEKVKLN